jgi:NADPH:quinone reductase-like Zn-dependent oxidoreductase
LFIFDVIGRYVKGTDTLPYDCLIGMEFAGRRTETGERVFGFSLYRSIATFVDARDDLITSIPENWSMEDAVTILMTYCTVWYGLIDRAQMHKSIKTVYQ